MAWRISPDLNDALLGGDPQAESSVIASITITEPGGNDIIAAASGLDIFDIDHWILIVDPAEGANHNLLLKVLAVSATQIGVLEGSLTAAGATQLCLINFGNGGSVKQILKNSVIEGYTGTRPATADMAPTGTKLIEFTKDAGTFVAGEPTNGLNLAEFEGTTMKRAIDPTTGLVEIWKGLGLAAAGTGTSCGWARWSANDKGTIRMDGVVATSGGDLSMINGVTIVEAINSEISDVAITMTGV